MKQHTHKKTIEKFYHEKTLSKGISKAYSSGISKTTLAGMSETEEALLLEFFFF